MTGFYGEINEKVFIDDYLFNPYGKDNALAGSNKRICRGQKQ